MVALKIDKISESFLIVSIKPSREFFRKALKWKFKIPSAIAAACPKRSGLTNIRPDLVYIGKYYSSLLLSPSQAILELELLLY